MAQISGRGLSRLVTTAVAVALVGGSAGVAAAQTTGEQAAAAKKPSASAPVFRVGAITDKTDKFYVYEVDGKGGLKARQFADGNWKNVRQVANVDRDGDGRQDGTFYVENSDLKFIGSAGKARNVVPDYGFFYRGLISPGNLGGSQQSDLVALSKGGTAQVATVRDNGTISGETRLGGAEWGTYVDLAGRGDLTGDKKTDIVARDTKGVLWLYKGTGNAKKPFEARTKVGGGWGKYTKLFSNGDLNGDGRSDLLAVDKQGALFLYKGTGKQAAPFKAPVKIGNSGWNQYRLVF
ncbi:VCBS repeat-containing protein [Streptomyces sp. I05A-00742]|uniref:FG-GAP repeat domain-containing protein n=1 Tax=Streptomyces sp. I05A-00742 TaxID=2732853 RepID=UPI001487CE34|nr:VCBS repeat-containing protein [Streptomyces sp. I05A-00742]